MRQSSTRRLVIVGETPPPVHGASRVTQLFAETAQKAGIRVDVWSTSVAAGRLYHARRAARYARLATRILLDRDARGSAVYQTGAGGLGILYQAIIALSGRMRGSALTYHHHSYAYLTKPAAAMHLLVRCSGPRGLHIALSERMQRDLQAAYAIRRTIAVSNAVWLGSSAPSTRSHPETSGLVIGHLSNLSRAKGFFVSLEVSELLERQGELNCMRFAGPAADSEVRETLDSAATMTGVEWVGALTPGEVVEFLGSVDVLLFPSSYVNEALPLVVLESLRVGTPAIASPVGCLPELLGEAGWTCPPEPRLLAAALREVAQDPRARETAVALYESQRTQAAEDVVRQVMVG